ncbi:19091_t:CDS:10 [Rhizophagus irregularis]|nr:19091_t:CDS:10 [Rhizophagus irregularis]
MTDKTNPRPIRRLNETVVNRIAAGEELIENSLDAGASNIQITVKDGGLKLLQILDNGHGIRKEDMTIVCERFTTSKLKNFEDLSNINTACYSDGKLVPAKPGTNAEPKACAGNTGTQITAEDLFYNVPTRRKALKSPSDEYNRILDVVNRYAIHNSGVSFTCKKQGSNQAEVNTLSMSSVLDNIRQIYGSIASELLGLSNNISNNIKDRAVENSSLKKAIESIYTTYLPKNTHPFAYLSLEINPQNVDVNVHPTKREVRFLNEDEVIAAVGDAIQESLAGANSSRTFLTQTLLPGAESIETNTNLAENSIKKSGVKVLNYKLVRTDSRVQTLDDFCNPDNTFNMQPKDNPKKGNNNFPNSSKNIVNSNVGSSNLKRKRERFDVRLTSILTLRKRLKEIEHKGLTELLANHTFVGCVDDSLTLALVQHQTKLYMVNYNVLSEELFYQLALYGFHNFGFIHLSIPAPIRELTIFALESCDHDKSEDLKPNEEISQNGELATLPLMLKGYAPNLDKLPTFLLRLGTEVDWETETGCFETLSRELGLFYAPEPPNFSNISTSISNNQDDNSMDICDTSNVNKDNSLLLPKRKSSEKETNLIFTEQQKKAEIARYKWQIEHLIFPTLKSQFIAPKSIAENGHVLQIANLPDLYRIFERC